ncbi:hypothetical protein ACVU7I_00615 [Patulibacter sp. S7RM1-6]
MPVLYRAGLRDGGSRSLGGVRSGTSWYPSVYVATGNSAATEVQILPAVRRGVSARAPSWSPSGTVQTPTADAPKCRLAHRERRRYKWVMPVPKRPIEGSVVTGFDFVVLAEQDQLEHIPDGIAEKLHLYMVCSRPRIAVVPDEFRATSESCSFVFTVQHGDARRRIEFERPNFFGCSDVAIRSKWPYGDFELLAGDGEVLTSGRSSLLLTAMKYHDDDLDLEVLYVGQAYGSKGSRSASQRLAAHETLQAIYGEAVRRSPDKDVFLVLLSLADPYGLIALSPVPGESESIVSDFQRLTTPLSEQQRLNFTEAALIRHFAPPYNREFKNTFPSPAHKTYAECYEMDLNMVAFELETSEMLRVRLYSETVPRLWYQAREFPLHDPAVRRSMFDFGPG